MHPIDATDEQLASPPERGSIGPQDALPQLLGDGALQPVVGFFHLKLALPCFRAELVTDRSRPTLSFGDRFPLSFLLIPPEATVFPEVYLERRSAGIEA